MISIFELSLSSQLQVTAHLAFLGNLATDKQGRLLSDNRDNSTSDHLPKGAKLDLHTPVPSAGSSEYKNCETVAKSRRNPSTVPDKAETLRLSRHDSLVTPLFCAMPLSDSM